MAGIESQVFFRGRQLVLPKTTVQQREDGQQQCLPGNPGAANSPLSNEEHQLPFEAVGPLTVQPGETKHSNLLRDMVPGSRGLEGF